MDVKKNLRNKRTDLQTNNARGLISKTFANLSYPSRSAFHEYKMSDIDAVSRHKVGLRAESIGFGRWSKGHNKYDNGSVLLFMGPVGDGLLYLYPALTHNTFISVFDTFFNSLFDTTLVSITYIYDGWPSWLHSRITIIVHTLSTMAFTHKTLPPPHSFKNNHSIE